MLSIIIPTFQEEKRLGKTLACVAILTVPHEIIVSDGNSTDKTVEIARRYTDKIVVWSGTGRQKPGVGRNDGARLATGDFLVFLDSGSVIPSPDEFFAAALRQFDQPRVVALTAPVRVPADQQRLRDLFFQGLINFTYWFMNNVLRSGGAMGRFQMMRRSAYDAVGGYRDDLTFYEDVNLFRRLATVGRTVYDRSLTIYHEESRARHVGWAKLMWLWFLNNTWQFVLHRPYSKEWAPIR